MARALCDGCWEQLTAAALAIFQVNGVQVRYCTNCKGEWLRFKASCDAEAARHQRELDLWEEQARPHVKLYVTPLDFPQVAVDAAGHAVVLR